MIDLQWLSDRLCDVLRWQLANPGADEFTGPEVPWAGRRIWSIFLELNAARGSGGFGPNAISLSEIEAFSRLRRELVRPWEVDILRALDVAYMKAARDRVEQEVTPKPEVNTRPMSPHLFDALFP